MPLPRLLSVAFLLSLAACGGGGGGSTTIGSGQASELAGQVLVPNGVVASLEKPGLADKILNLLVPSAVADLIGIAAAPAGTAVELVRLNATASVSFIISSTTTDNAGRFSFDLDALGVSPDITLAIRTPNAQLRAFVTNENNVDLTPESETIFQRIQNQLTMSANLTDFTINEVEALVSGLRRASTANGGSTIGLAVSGTVAALDTILTGNADLNNFVTTASAAGEAARGPGDNNYVPLTQGAVYTYRGNSTLSGNYTNTITISGTQSVDGVTTTRFVSTDLLNGGPDTAFVATDLTGVFDYSVVALGFSDSPLPLVLFPNIADQSIVSDEVITIFGSTFRFTLTTSAAQTLMVDAGVFTDVVRVRGSVIGINNSDREIEDSYFAPDIGLIRRVNDSTIGGVNEVVTEELLTMPVGL